MPNVGWAELMVILLIALLVFGPNKLPDMMKSFGRAMRSFQDESTRAIEQLKSATDLDNVETHHGVIDRPDGFQPEEEVAAAAPVVLYNRNPAGVVPGEASEPATEPKTRAHAPRKRASTTAKKATPRKTASNGAKSSRTTASRTSRKPASNSSRTPAKKAAPKPTAPLSIEAFEDT